MDKRVEIWRRAVEPGNPGGVPRGPFQKAFTAWAQLIQATGVKALEAGLVEDRKRATLRLYAQGNNLTITIADRVKFDGSDYAVETVGAAERRRQFLEIVIVQQKAG